MKLMILFSLLISLPSFAGDIKNISSILCSNKFNSRFELGYENHSVSASFLGRNDGRFFEALKSDQYSKINFIRDHIQNGIIGLVIQASNEEGLSGELSVAFSSEQEFSLNNAENLSIVFKNNNDGEVYVENMDCNLSFSYN